MRRKRQIQFIAAIINDGLIGFTLDAIEQSIAIRFSPILAFKSQAQTDINHLQEINVFVNILQAELTNFKNGCAAPGFIKEL